VKLTATGALLLSLLLLMASAAAAADVSATPEEVIAKVREAASYLAKNVDSVLPEFNNPKGPWVWKDTYVFVMDCKNDTYVGHPMSDVLGTKISDLKDFAGNRVGLTECEAANNANGGWVEIMWPKLNGTKPERKICYVFKLPSSPYTVGSGIYEPTMTIDELNKLIK
jgi:cytochrome c